MCRVGRINAFFYSYFNHAPSFSFSSIVVCWCLRSVPFSFFLGVLVTAQLATAKFAEDIEAVVVADV